MGNDHEDHAFSGKAACANKMPLFSGVQRGRIFQEKDLLIPSQDGADADFDGFEFISEGSGSVSAEAQVVCTDRGIRPSRVADHKFFPGAVDGENRSMLVEDGLLDFRLVRWRNGARLLQRMSGRVLPCCELLSAHVKPPTQSPLQRLGG